MLKIKVWIKRKESYFFVFCERICKEFSKVFLIFWVILVMKEDIIYFFFVYFRDRLVLEECKCFFEI